MADTKPRLYGLMAEFHETDEILHAAEELHRAGYRKMEGYTPFPVEGLAETIGHHRSKLPALTFAGGALGMLTAFVMQYYACVESYPLNVGGRPLNSWPAFVPIMFELTVLGASFAAFFGMLALNGLPQPYHPLFNVPQFKLASRDRYFLVVQGRDPLFDPERTRQVLQALHAHGVYDVEP